VRLSIITDEISQDVRTAAELAATWGIHALELRTLRGGRLPNVPKDALDETEYVLKGEGMHVSAVSPGVGKMRLDDSGLEQQISATLPRAFEWAKRLDCTRAVIFGFVKPEGAAKAQDAEMPEEQIVDRLGRMADMAADAKLTLCVENEAVCWLDTGSNTARVLRRAAHPCLKANWDAGNAFHAGERAFPDGYNAIKGLVAHVHLKDCRIDGSSVAWVPIGEGQMGYPEQIAALRQDGYDGYWSVETHCTPKVECSRRSVENLRRMIAEIF